MELQWKRDQNTTYDSEEYWKLTEQLTQKYMPAMDVGACKKMLDGSQIVRRYNNEAERRIFIERDDGI